nr:PREDICTED: transmembrane emp24 domain-containing protein 3-like [Paralichthys olivaceus]
MSGSLTQSGYIDGPILTTFHTNLVILPAVMEYMQYGFIALGLATIIIATLVHHKVRFGFGAFLFFEVIAGGNYDVDCFVTDPQNNVLYNEKKKQYDSFSHTTAMKGVYKVCFSNEFSSFTYKTVYLDFRHGDEEPLMPNMNRNTALTQLESSCVSIHEVLKVVADSQTWYRLREAHDRMKAEHLLERVTYWSIGETVLLFVIGIGQVMLLRSFFVEKKGSVAAAT